MPTINDIAQACGTSPSTISKVLNGNDGKISAAKREEILLAVKRLQYRPAAHARSLAKRRANMIGVVTAQLPGMLSFQYNMVLINSILDETTARKQTLALFNGQIWEDDEKEQLVFNDGRCDGLIVLNAPSIPGLVPALLRTSIPFVVVNSGPMPEGVNSIDIDDVYAGYEATRHLIEHGHRRIAYFHHDPQAAFSLARLAGYQKALEEAGIPFDEQLVVEGNGIARFAYDWARALVTRDSTVTALFCAHDAIALAAMQGLKEMGYQIPRDYSIIGVNDIPDAACSVPPLTTISQDLEALGKEATRMLLELIDNPTNAARRVAWPTHLVERQSVGGVARGS
jgi:DNA-binding LacI/PurR family transcriptional regulator